MVSRLSLLPLSGVVLESCGLGLGVFGVPFALLGSFCLGPFVVIVSRTGLIDKTKQDVDKTQILSIPS